MDAAPPIWLPPKPAVIRPATKELLRYGGDPALAMLPGMTPLAVAPQGYSATGVTFGGTTERLTRGGGLTGAADSKLLTVSLWVKADTDGSGQQLVHGATTLGGSGTAFYIERSSANGVTINGRNTANSTILQISSTAGSLNAAAGWVHVLASVDLSNTSNRHLYIDGSSDLATVTTYTNDTMDFTRADWSVGARGGGSEYFDGDMADVMVWFGVYVDLSVTANRELFIVSGKPVNPTTAIASLGTPIIALYGDVASWETNKGSGGGFTESGTLTEAATSPSD